MRSLYAATAAVSTALLLAACAGTDTTEPASDASTTPETSTETEAVDTLTTCSGYYDGGELSIDHRVATWGADVAEPATEENGAELTIIRDRLGAQIRYADTDAATILESLQAPFDDALNGESADPAVVEDAAAELEALCVEAGFELPA